MDEGTISTIKMWLTRMEANLEKPIALSKQLGRSRAGPLS